MFHLNLDQFSDFSASGSCELFTQDFRNTSIECFLCTCGHICASFGRRVIARFDTLFSLCYLPSVLCLTVGWWIVAWDSQVIAIARILLWRWRLTHFLLPVMFLTTLLFQLWTSFVTHVRVAIVWELIVLVNAHVVFVRWAALTIRFFQACSGSPIVRLLLTIANCLDTLPLWLLVKCLV